MPGNDANTKLLLHCNGADTSTTFTDSSVAAPTHIVTSVGNAQLETAVKKWGTASGLFDGTGDYLTIPDSADWDIVADNTDNQTVDLQVKHATYAGPDYYITQNVDATHFWQLYHQEGSQFGLVFSFYTNSQHYARIVSRSDITDTDWHHIALIKVGTYYGIYKDGLQVGYAWETFEHTFDGLLYIGNQSAGSGGEFDGNLDEIRVQDDNYFTAAPNSFPAAPLLLYGEGVDEATTMSNDGYSGAVTMVGGAKLDDGAKKFNATTSMFFDGTSDYLSVVDTSGTDYDIAGSATDSWTIDLWEKKASTGTEQFHIQQSAVATDEWYLQTQSSTWRFRLKISDVQRASLTSTSTEDTNWHHIAVVKSASNWGLYIDGVQEDYASNSDTATFAAGLFIGRQSLIAQKYFDGYMEQAQITKGNKFGVTPKALIASFDGADAATSFTAETGQTATFVANAQLDTGVTPKVGTASLLLDGTGDYVTFPDSASWDIGGGQDFTIDTWVRFSDVTETTQTIVGQYVDTSNHWRLLWYTNPSWVFHSIEGGANKAYYYTTSGTGTPTPTVDTWYHIAFEKSGSDAHFFIDGVEQTLTTSQTWTTWSPLASVLNVGIAQPGHEFFGHIDQFRLTNGQALWTSAFTPPGVDEGITVPTAVLTQDTITEPTEEYSKAALGRAQAVIIA